MIKVYLGIPTTGSISDTLLYAIREWEKNYREQIEFVMPERCTRRIFHDFARSAIVDDFLATDCDILWFIDSDVTPPKHAPDLITKHGDKWQVAGAPYPVFQCFPGSKDPSVVMTVYNGTDGMGLAPSECPYEGTDWVDGLATGCMMIKRDIFARLTKPWFEFKYEQETRHMLEGEDIGFCRKLNALGIRFFVDYGMVCKHQKSVCLLEVNNYATNCANKMVAAYDQMIRGKMETLAKAAFTQRQTPSTEQFIKPKLVLP
ncbi:MAG: hypothetical protein KGL39_51320 [Patescibacteria group bacterium]|nr:hypothetical protein [Patescibacteria group bacterium]